MTVLNKEKMVIQSPIGIGCRLWGSIDPIKAQKLINCALKYEINFFDTADIYSKGKSEEVLGVALGQTERKKVIIATKGGMRSHNGRHTQDSSPKYLNKAINASLKRLQTDYIDLYQIHYYDPVTNPQEVALCLKEYLETGEIKAIGLSNLNSSDLHHWLSQDFVKPISLQLPWNMLQRDSREVIEKANQANLTILGYTPLLAGLFTENIPDSLRKEIPPNTMTIAEEYRSILQSWAEKHGLSISEAAILWTLYSLETNITLLGVRGKKHLETCHKLLRLHSNSKFKEEILEFANRLPEKLPGTIITQKVINTLKGWDNTNLATIAMGINLPVPNDVKKGNDIEIDIFTGKFVNIKSI